MSQKKRVFVASLSVLAGLASSILFKREAPNYAHQNKNSILYYIGTWSFEDESTGFAHHLEIRPDFSFILDRIELEGTIQSVEPHALTFIDHYGYQLIVHAKHQRPISLYDEADDRTYPFIYKDEE